MVASNNDYINAYFVYYIIEVRIVKFVNNYISILSSFYFTKSIYKVIELNSIILIYIKDNIKSLLIVNYAVFFIKAL